MRTITALRLNLNVSKNPKQERLEHETPTSWLDRSEHNDSLMDDDVDDVDNETTLMTHYNMMDDDEDNDDGDGDDGDDEDTALQG